jgi:hypothetical protein
VRPGGLASDPLRVVARRHQQDGGGVDTDTLDGEQPPSGGLDELAEQAVEFAVVGFDGQHPPAEGAHRQLGGVGDVVAAGPRSQPSSSCGQRCAANPAKRFSQLIGAAETEVTELVETGNACLATGSFGDQQRPHCFDRTVAGLGNAAGPPGEHGSGSLDGIGRVGLPGPPAGLTVGSIDLDHLEPAAP